MASEPQPIIIKKKKKHGHGHHGGAWKLAYADLVTAMMAFFLVMWIIGLDVNTKQGIASYFNNPGAFKVNFAVSRNVFKLDGRPPPAPDQSDENDITTKYIDLQWARLLQTLLEDRKQTDPVFKDHARHVAVTITDKGLQIELIEDANGVFFKPGSAELTDRAKGMIRVITNVIGTTPRPLRIIGHVDRGQQKPGAPGKMEFGLNRARAVYNALIANGYRSGLCRQVSSRSDLNPSVQDPANIANSRVTILLPFEPE
jgi:chemotaxis protein MotB